MNRFFELDLLTWSCSLLLDVLRDDINAFDHKSVFFWKRAEDFCLYRDFLLDTVFIFLNAVTVFTSNDADDISGMYFHFLHR